MFENIGSKIKILAVVTCWVGIIGGVILALVGIIRIEDGEWILFGSGLITALASWPSTFALYGFGQVVEDIHVMRNKPVAVSSMTVESETKKNDVLPEL